MVPSAAFKSQDRLVLLAALLVPTLITLVYFVWLAKSAPVVYAPLKLLQFGLPAVWIYAVRRERRALLEPVPQADLARSLGIGGAFGLAVVAAGVAIYLGLLAPLLEPFLPAIDAKVSDMQLSTPQRFALLAVFYSLIHSLLEEYYWRWFVFRECRREFPLAAAMIVSSLGFMAHHVLVLSEFFGWQSPLTYLLSLAVAVGGLFWAWLYERYGTLYGPWLSHLLIDAGIFGLGYHLVFGR